MNRLSFFLKTSLVSFLLTFLYIYSSLSAEDVQPRQEWKMDESYTGSLRSEYDQLRWKVPGLMRQTELNLSVRTGLNFQEGWQYQLTIRFVDDIPPGLENALAWVQLGGDDKGHFAQFLNVNLAAYSREKFNFEKVFAHELTHAMVNDSLGGPAALVLPIWFHEGIAVFAANQGDQMVEVYANQFYPNAAQQILNGLDGPHGALDYAEDYLAFKYVWERKGMNAFHNFIKEVTKRKGDIPGALQYTCNVSYENFQNEVRSYGAEVIKSLGVPRRGDATRPY